MHIALVAQRRKTACCNAFKTVLASPWRRWSVTVLPNPCCVLSGIVYCLGGLKQRM